ncbi:hypothetical protein [Arsenicibacter rosenii]|uniref:Uncharacterized protein n=1 Tax=Arsenicibacter rosenii TaxID=1750698 RepID=A0A1S2VNZ7_9BACT|nr:hypothetical protein [Arsenicibacter rosenii]OIN60483.1 hypothetical protein BLX24_06600 [Arsenicibacter rosenii]
MQKLSTVQLARLRHELRRRTAHREVPATLTRQLAREIEVLMAAGRSYEEALLMTVQRNNPRTRHRQLYTGAATRIPGRHQRHLVAAQWPTWMRGSVIAFVTLMICMMWVGRLFTISPAVFKTVWMVALGGMVCAYSAQRLFRMER